MSFNRLNYDVNTYKHNLTQSVGVGSHVLDLNTNCKPCLSEDTYIQQGYNNNFNATCKNQSQIDVDSELKLITRKASKDPANQYLPHEVGKPFCEIDNNVTVPCSQLPNESTRISNPPCTLRSSGWNRFEWLPHNPQETAIIPFANMVSNRIIVKDNHRPCIPRPISQEPCLPSKANNNVVLTGLNQQCGNSSSLTSSPLHSTQWKSCDLYKYYSG